MPKEPFTSIKNLTSAAENGDPMAQEKLALSYLEGFGVTKDYAQARLWYARSAGQNDPGGHFGLAVMHAMGFGGAQDFLKAYVHLLLMQRQPVALKKRWSEDIASRMLATVEHIAGNLSENERKQAALHADVWKP